MNHFKIIFIIPVILIFNTHVSIAQNYTCDKQVFDNLGIKIQKSIICAKQVGQRVHFTHLKKQIKETFINYQKKRKSPKRDRYQNNSSYKLQQTVLKDENGKYIPIYFNKDGVGIRAKFYDNGADYFKDGLARYQYKGRIGFIDKSGKIKILAQYPFVSPFENGYAKACIKCTLKNDGEYNYFDSEEWFFINKSNRKFTTPLKNIKLPFELAFQKKMFKKKVFDNTPNTRKVLFNYCHKDTNNKKACINYASFILEESLSFDLGHYNYNLRNISHSQMIKPSKKQISEDQLLIILDKLIKKDSKIKIHLAIAYYSLGHTKKSLHLLNDSCKKEDSGEACHFYGVFLDLQQKLKPAIEAFNQACQLKINHSCENKLMLQN